MPRYHLHILDRLGDLIGAVDLDCIDDEAAKARGREASGSHGAELWRLVKVVGREGSPKPLIGSRFSRL